MDANKIWATTKVNLKKEFTRTNYDIYIESLIPISIDNNTLYMKGRDIRTKDFYEREAKKIILDKLDNLAINIKDFKVVFNDEYSEMLSATSKNTKNNTNENRNNKINQIKKISSLSDANLNVNYTFDTYISGSSNNIAKAACQRVANYDYSDDNPLFLYGGVGLGKTHLMNAIGNRILELDPSKNVLFVSSETFLNEHVSALRFDKRNEFREKYRNVDVLLVDDVQFFSRKDSIQVELFHTFNDLFRTGKKIIFSSDRVPNEIPDIEDRLKSRLGCGLMVDIQAPDYATKIAILQVKREGLPTEIPDEVLDYIASNIKSNIRDLNGAFNRVVSYADFSNLSSISLNQAKDILKDIIISSESKKLDVLKIKETVAFSYNVTVEDLDSKKRTQNITIPRQVAMFLSRELLDISLPAIGKSFGNRDHSTVLHAIDKINDLCQVNETMKIRIERLKSELLD